MLVIQIIKVIWKMFLAYMITCFIFGTIAGIYLFYKNKNIIINSDEKMKKLSDNNIFIGLMYLGAIFIATKEFIIKPSSLFVNFEKNTKNNIT